MKILVFAGVDKVGKSTLIREVHKATSYKYPILDRFTESSITYGMHRRRKLNYDEYYEIEKKLSDEVILFYITASDKVIKKRIVENNEKDITFDEIKKLKNEYQKYLKKTHFKTYIIDTTNKTIKQSVKEIVKCIDFENNVDGLRQIQKLGKDIVTNGNIVGETKELTNVNIEFKDLKLDDISKYCKKNDMNFFQINDDEKYYYDRIYYSLRHIIKAQKEEYNQDNLSRRFVYTSNECINSYHCLLRNNVLECFINLRSSNVFKILPFDVFYCKLIANRINAEFFNAKKIRCYFQIDSAHVYLNKEKYYKNANTKRR